MLDKTNGLPENKVIDIYQDSKQRMWVFTPGSINLWTGTSFSSFDAWKKKEVLPTFWEDKEGRLLYCDRQAKKVFRYMGQGFEHVQSALYDSLNLNKLIHGFNDKKGNTWFVEAPSTIFKYDGKQLIKVANLSKKFGFTGIGCVSDDHLGNLWFGTFRGVIKYDGKNFKWFRDSDGINEANTIEIYQDREKVLWFVGEKGIHKYYDDQLTFWDKIQNIKFPQIVAISRDNDGVVWLGSWQSVGLLKFKNGKFIERVVKEKTPGGNVITSLYHDKKGYMWAGTQRGLIKYKGNKQINHFTTRDGLVSKTVNSITADSRGHLWLGHWHGGVTYYDGVKFQKIDIFEKHNVKVIFIDSKERVWVGTNKGLYKYENESWTHFDKTNGLTSEYITAITEDYKGNLWLATFRGGVVLYDHQTFEIFTENDGLPMNSAYGIIAEKRYKSLWLNTKGLAQLNLEEFYKTGKFILKVIGKETGMLGAFYLDPKHNLWFSNSKGFGWHTIKKEPPSPAPLFHIESVKLFWETPQWKKYTDSLHYGIPYNLLLPYNQNHLTFSVIGVTSIAPGQVHYQYRLLDYDKKWSPLTTKREITYSNLAPGNYTLHIKAINSKGVWAKPIEYHFVIIPPFWQTTWFYLCLALVSLLLVLVVIRWRTRKLQQQKVVLENKVAARTKEVNDKNEKLLQKNEEIKTQSEEIKAQAEELKNMNEQLLELDDFKQGVTGMIVHDLKNPLNTLLAFAKSPEIKQSAQQMLHMVLNILDVQKIESAGLQLHWDVVSLNEVINEAIAQVNVLSQQKNLTIKIEMNQRFTVKTDKDICLRILVNLLTNAIKHAPLNSQIEIGATPTTDKIKISVADQGAGVPPELQEKVFGKFFSMEAKKNNLTLKSTGLGLTFCKLATEAQEGTIGVRNAPGGGAVFWFTLQLINTETRTETLIANVSANTLVLSPDDKAYLQPYIAILAPTAIYEMSKIKSVIDSIAATQSTNIQQWKEYLEEATFSMNEIWYNELIQLAGSEKL